MSAWSWASSAGFSLLTVLAGCRSTGEASPGADEDVGGRDLVSGWSRTEVRGRASDGEHDLDLYETVYADVGDPLVDRVTGHLMGTVYADLDGDPSSGDGDFPFGSLQDTFDSPVTAQLFHGYVAFHELDDVETLKIGRHVLRGTPEIAWLDGASAETRELGGLRFRLGAYGGRQAIPYESSGDGDSLSGLWLEARPWKGGRVRADWMNAQEDTDLGSPDDDLLAGGLWQQIDPRLFAEVQYSRIGSRSRDVRVAGRWFDVARNLGFTASYYRLLETQEHLAIPLDPFYSTLHALEPYFQIRASVAKGFGEWLHLDAGVDRRRLIEEQDTGQFNRDFRRYYATGVLQELLPWDVELALTGELFHADGSDIDAASADLSKELDGGWRAAFGTYYSLYEYDVFEGVEREDVRTWFLRFREDPSEPRSLDVRYEYERSYGEDFHQVRLGMTWRF
jgi:hypothetical protein